MEKLLQLLERNAHYTNEELAVMLGTTVAEVEKKIEAYENLGVIRGYKTVIDHNKLEEERVYALIELKVTPHHGTGFDEIAEQIVSYPQVQNLYLMSGGYDLAVMITAHTFKDVALFVSQRLAQLDSVLSTATHFILSKYKESGVSLMGEEVDERGNIGL
jgi:DNA-binding Lrp family transcriptional regulator